MPRSTLNAGALLIGTVVWVAICGCGPSDETASPGSETAKTPRIVSLSPALSRTLLDLGLGDLIVGRSAFCASLPQEIPVVGNLYEVDYERLIRLEPTHVLVQPPSASGPDPQLERLGGRHGWTIAHWTINSIDDIERVIRDLPGVLYADRPDRQALVAGRAAEMLNEIAAALTPPGDGGWRGRTLLVSDTEPVWVFGHGTYLHDILTAMGGANAVGAQGWVQLSLEDVGRLDPEAIIIVRDRGSSDLDPLEAAGPLRKLDTTARRRHRVAVLWHPDAKLPSSGVVGVAQEMRRVLEALVETDGAP
ncbi:MAG: ABC transporter substrate-binding protein [Planctomycetota bacterium]|jgi:ABC-type Fe3+-hydroxamate transport system substrate-binding protein